MWTWGQEGALLCLRWRYTSQVACMRAACCAVSSNMHASGASAVRNRRKQTVSVTKNSLYLFENIQMSRGLENATLLEDNRLPLIRQAAPPNGGGKHVCVVPTPQYYRTAQT